MGQDLSAAQREDEGGRAELSLPGALAPGWFAASSACGEVGGGFMAGCQWRACWEPSPSGKAGDFQDALLAGSGA